jgi:subtilase family serine protease
VADPATGVAVYDSFTFGSHWLVFGGTSVSSPIIASIYALAGNAGSVNYGSFPYSHTGSLFDITSGSNGSCAVSYLCTAGAGYDGPTGNGTPNGTGGF